MLRALMIRAKLDGLRKTAEELRTKDEDLKKREDEAAKALEEATAEKVSDEDMTTLEGIVDGLVQEREALDKELKGNADSIAELETELKTLEEEQRNKAANATQTRTSAPVAKNEEPNGGVREMIGNIQLRDKIFKTEEVKDWLSGVRDIISGKRSIAHADLTIPEVVLPLITDNIEKTSKLYKRVTVRRITGTARERILGLTPPAFWLEMYGADAIQELTLSFSQVEVDGFMVAAILTVPNALLEDNDVNLGSIIVESLAKSIALALDQAIVYGKGKEAKQPLGIVSGIKVENKVQIATEKHGKELFTEIINASGKLNTDYAVGGITWMMNQATYTRLVVESLSFNANGALVSAVNKTMPVVGGDIEILNFMKDGEILGGYADLYLLAERAGQKLEKSDQTFFITNQTVFKGTARYDGVLVFDDAFVAITLDGKTFTDTTNAEQTELDNARKKNKSETETVVEADKKLHKKD